MKTKPTSKRAQMLVDRRKSEIERAEAELAKRREKLADALAELADVGYSYRELGELTGFTKQYAGDLVLDARARRSAG